MQLFSMQRDRKLTTVSFLTYKRQKLEVKAFSPLFKDLSSMYVILILIGASLFVALIFLTAFIWANKTGQYEDAHTPAVRMLFDDEPANAPNSTGKSPLNNSEADGRAS